MDEIDKTMQDGFGRPIDEAIYWHNTGLSESAIERVKEYHKTHPVQPDGTRLKDKGRGLSSKVPKPPEGCGLL